MAKILISVILILCTFAKASERESYLRRTSILLRGFPPANSDYQKVSSISESQFKKYLSRKIAEYMNSPEYEEKMRIHILELLQLKVTSKLIPNLFIPEVAAQDKALNYLTPQSGESVLDSFLISMFRENKSWDHLLTGTSYVIDDRSLMSEMDFYQFFLNKQIDRISPDNNKYKIKDSRFAGVVTTPRFFERYFSSRKNENRKRAAALFRVFLCDEMKPKTVFNESTKSRLMDGSLNINEDVNNRKSGLSTAKRHGSDISCMGCHYKLDPLGKAFDFSSDQLSPKTVSSYLTYEGQNGKHYKINFSNFNEMAKAITTRTEYRECQVKHIWDWFVGRDIPVTNINSLSRKFDSLGRKPKEFITYVLVEGYRPVTQVKQTRPQNSSFEPVANRAMQNVEFYLSLKTKFKLDNDFFNQCRLNKNDLTSIGFLDTVTGKVFSRYPILNTYQIYHKCSKNLPSSTARIGSHPVSFADWSLLSREKKIALVKFLVVDILGEGVFNELTTNEVAEKILKSTEDQLNDLREKNNAGDINKLIASSIVLTPEFLFY